MEGCAVVGGEVGRQRNVRPFKRLCPVIHSTKLHMSSTFVQLHHRTGVQKSVNLNEHASSISELNFLSLISQQPVSYGGPETGPIPSIRGLFFGCEAKGLFLSLTQQSAWDCRNAMDVIEIMLLFIDTYKQILFIDLL